MIKLLICLFSAAALGVFMLQLRHEHLELGYDTAALHEQIKSQQGKLWNQQLKIAMFTAPNNIEKTVEVDRIDMVPAFSVGPQNQASKDTQHDADAE